MQTMLSSGKNTGKNNYLLRTICKDTDVANWRRAQEEDEEIGFLLKKKIEGVKSTWQEISSYLATTKYLCLEDR